jgi:hypothetical protein
MVFNIFVIKKCLEAPMIDLDLALISASSFRSSVMIELRYFNLFTMWVQASFGKERSSGTVRSDWNSASLSMAEKKHCF